MKNFCPLGKCACILYFKYFWCLRMKQQKEESLSETNRYFFAQRYGRLSYCDNELIIYYIENGGASGFEERELWRAFDPII